MGGEFIATRALRAAAQRLRQAAFLRRHRGRVRLGRGCRIPFRTLHVEANRVEIGDEVTLGERTVLKGDFLRIGDYFLAGNDVIISGQNARFETGKFCSLASRTTVLLGQGNHRIQSLSSYPIRHLPPFASAEWSRYVDFEAESRTYCRLGHDVWVGTGSILLPNVTLGTGAVVSAGSLVMRDVPPYAIVGGNPAQIISFRFKPSLIRELLELQWWDWPAERILRNVALFAKNLTTQSSLAGLLPRVES